MSPQYLWRRRQLIQSTHSTVAISTWSMLSQGTCLDQLGLVEAVDRLGQRIVDTTSRQPRPRVESWTRRGVRRGLTTCTATRDHGDEQGRSDLRGRRGRRSRWPARAHWPNRAAYPQGVSNVSEGGLEPPCPLRALAPQASASTYSATRTPPSCRTSDENYSKPGTWHRTIPSGTPTATAGAGRHRT